MPEVIPFQTALKQGQELGNLHLLLGNGFSIACRPEIFQYSKLFQRADFQRLSSGARKAFDVLATQDFERVIKVLRDAHLILKGYEIDVAIAECIIKDADILREVLIGAISASHPARPSDVPTSEYESCRRFLSNFRKVYTLSYDLLLYWAQMQDSSEVTLHCDDGFRKPESNPEAPYVTWESATSYDQNTFYIHGGLHIIDTGVDVRKLTWTNTGIPLIDQITEALSQHSYPLFVSEGTSHAKLSRIRHSDYLSKCYRSLREIQGGLFIYGLSMAENDEHILNQVQLGKVSSAFVSIFGDPTSKENRVIVRRMEKMVAARPKKRQLSVSYFDATSARIWR